MKKLITTILTMGLVGATIIGSNAMTIEEWSDAINKTHESYKRGEITYEESKRIYDQLEKEYEESKKQQSVTPAKVNIQTKTKVVDSSKNKTVKEKYTVKKSTPVAKPIAKPTVINSNNSNVTNTQADDMFKGATKEEKAYNLELIKLINEYRVQNGLNELTFDQDMQEFSTWKINALSDELLYSEELISHDLKNATYKEQIRNANPVNRPRTEIITGGYKTREMVNVEKILQNYKKSSSHNKIMLSNSITKISLGTKLAKITVNGEERYRYMSVVNFR